MRVGVLPRWQHVDEPQSLALVLLDQAREWLRQDPGLHVSFAVPYEAGEDELDRWFRPVLAEQADRVSFVPAYRRKPGRLVGIAAGSGLVDFCGWVDVVVSSQPGGTSQMRRWVDKPWVQWHVWTAVQDALDVGFTMFGDQYDLAVESTGVLYADVNVWESEFMLRAHARTLRQWFKPGVIGSVLDRSVVVPNGIDLPDVGRTEHGPTMLWGGNPNVGSKRFPRSLQALDQVQRYRGGRVIVTAPIDLTYYATLYEGMEFRSFTGRDEFLKTLAEADVFVCNSTMETYGVGWLEMLAGGVLGVFEQAWWLNGLLPVWYPFIAESVEQQVAMTVAILSGGEWVEQIRRDTQAWVREEHGIERASRKMLDVIKGVAR